MHLYIWGYMQTIWPKQVQLACAMLMRGASMSCARSAKRPSALYIQGGGKGLMPSRRVM